MRVRAALLALLPGAALAQAPSGAALGWEAMVVAFAPALRACLAGQRGAMAIDAQWLGPMRVGARLLLPGGVREDCVADIGTGAIESRDAAGPAREGEGLRAFMLERSCVDAWRVTTPLGQELGWLAYPGCG